MKGITGKIKLLVGCLIAISGFTVFTFIVPAESFYSCTEVFSILQDAHNPNGSILLTEQQHNNLHLKYADCLSRGFVPIGYDET